MEYKKELINNIIENIAYQQQMIKEVEEQVNQNPYLAKDLDDRQKRMIFLQSCLEDIDILFNSLNSLVELAKNDTGASKVSGQFLLSLYNSRQSSFSPGDLRFLDDSYWRDAINVLRLERLNFLEIHKYLVDGYDIFYQMVEDWGD